MASKLFRHSHLQALTSSIFINNHIRSPHYSNLNPNRAPLSCRLFCNASSSSSTGGFQQASSLKDLEFAKFASITEICYRLFSNASSSSSTRGFQRASSLKDLELAKFASIAKTWWDSEGLFKPLHVRNPTRLAFIRTRPVAIPT
nr:ubiquinone biosynthesis o-methyltransferase, mitochondrial [Quercus suber]